jgi:hypothetical protein
MTAPNVLRITAILITAAGWFVVGASVAAMLTGHAA